MYHSVSTLRRSFSILVLLVTMVQATRAQDRLWGLMAEGGDNGVGAIISLDKDGSDVRLEASLPAIPGSSPVNNDVIQLANGKIYGTVYGGGSYLKGVLYEFDPGTKQYTVKHHFDGAGTGNSPNGALVKANNNKLYGVTLYGGANDRGVIFEFDPATGVVANVHDFNITEGALPVPGMIVLSNGKLCGVTFGGGSADLGVLFTFDPSTGAFSKKYDFNSTVGGMPQCGLTQSASGDLFGLAYGGGTYDKGTIYKYDATANTVTKVLDFSGPDGASPLGRLVSASTGQLFGLTLTGGTSDKGTLFLFNPATSQVTTKVNFDGGALGKLPYGSLMEGPTGKLYGVNEQSDNGSGTIFEYTIASNSAVSIHDFTSDAWDSRTTLMKAQDGRLYGVTRIGGKGLPSGGVLFSISPVTKDFRIDVNFGAAIDGNWPLGPLMQGQNGKLYAVTYMGGLYNGGTIIEYDINTHVLSKKYDFQLEGTNPVAGFVRVCSGKLMGMTRFGGAAGNGVIFEFDPESGAYTKKVDFTNETGRPVGDLTLLPDGRMYGVTGFGYGNDKGAIFEYDPSTNVLTKKVDFDGPLKGNEPAGTLLLHDGKLYGLANRGGASDKGTLFSFDPESDEFEKLVDFYDGNGAYPMGSLVKAPNGLMYGAANSGGAAATIFEFNPATAQATARYDGTGGYTNGVDFRSGLTLSPNGKLYGIGAQGGNYKLGVIYEFNPNTNQYIKKVDLNGKNGGRPLQNTLLLVSSKEQFITFELEDKFVSDPAFELSATASSGLPVTYTSSNPDVATVNGTTVTPISVGTTVITATQAGNASFFPASNCQTLIVLEEPLGTSDEMDQSFAFYPNPVRDNTFVVEIRNARLNPDNIFLVDMLGRPVAISLERFDDGKYKGRLLQHQSGIHIIGVNGTSIRRKVFIH